MTLKMKNYEMCRVGCKGWMLDLELGSGIFFDLFVTLNIFLQVSCSLQMKLGHFFLLVSGILVKPFSSNNDRKCPVWLTRNFKIYGFYAKNDARWNLGRYFMQRIRLDRKMQPKNSTDWNLTKNLNQFSAEITKTDNCAQIFLENFHN